MVEQILIALAVAAAGAYITWAWGERKFDEGMVYALCNHHKGSLTYEVYEEEEGEVLEITIKE